jgi:hypothetical protein
VLRRTHRNGCRKEVVKAGEIMNYSTIPINRRMRYWMGTVALRLQHGQLEMPTPQTACVGTARVDLPPPVCSRGEDFRLRMGLLKARIKIPFGQGIWPAFWMLGESFGEVDWPACGEIDIMENIGREPGIVHGTVHGPGYSGANGISGLSALPEGRAMKDEFHIFAVEWQPGVIRWYMDNHLYFEVMQVRLPKGTSWPFDHPFFLLLNMAIGGEWPGGPDDTTVFPQVMLIDFVRVYQMT